MTAEKTLDEAREYVQKNKKLKAICDKLKAELGVKEENLEKEVKDLQEAYNVSSLEALNELIETTSLEIQTLIGASL